MTAAIEVVIGLEIHLQVATVAKAFCACPVAFGGEPNTRCCPVCLGHPGALPVANPAAIEHGIRLALALGCRIPPRTKFDRKHYGYPDLPKGYQITQYDRPLGRDGSLNAVGITRVHLEEDTGRCAHTAGETLLDFNRAGVPLLEIVTRPDLRSARKTVEFVRALREIAVAVGVSGGRFEQGQMRCEPNVNLRVVRGTETIATPIVEIKNLNSLANLRTALEDEIERQRRGVDAGEIDPGPSTRGFDEERGATVHQRRKESETDYRYFPEPDLPLIDLDLEPGLIETLRRDLPELPETLRARLREDHGLGGDDVEILVGEPGLAGAFEETVAAGAPAREAANWLLGDIRRDRIARGIASEDYEVDPARLATLIRLVADGRLARAAAREVLDAMVETGADAETIVTERGLEGRPGDAEVEDAIELAIATQFGAATAYADGKDDAIGPLIGAVLGMTRGQADPEHVRRLIEERLRP